MTTSALQALIDGIKNLQVSDGKIDAAELQQVLSSFNSSKGFGDAESFASTIDFVDPLTVMSHSVSGAISFSVNASGSKIGSVTIVRLAANGTNVPTFSGTFKKSAGSQTYNNTASALNVIYFWYDGTDYWYTIDKQG